MKLQLLIALISFVTYSTQFNATCLNDYTNDKKCVNAVESLFGNEDFIYYNENGEKKPRSDGDGAMYPSDCEFYQATYTDLLCNLDSINTECPLDNYPDKKMRPVIETCTTEEERKKLSEFQSTYETAMQDQGDCVPDTNPNCPEPDTSQESQNQ